MAAWEEVGEAETAWEEVGEAETASEEDGEAETASEEDGEAETASEEDGEAETSSEEDGEAETAWEEVDEAETASEEDGEAETASEEDGEAEKLLEITKPIEWTIPDFLKFTEDREVGEAEKLLEITKPIEWTIPDFLKVTEDREYSCLYSPAFTVTGISFDLTLFTRSWDKTEGFVDLTIWSAGEFEYSVEFDLGLQKNDGNVEPFASGILGRENNESTHVSFIRKSELLSRKSELVPDDVLTITGNVKYLTEETPLFDDLVVEYIPTYSEQKTEDVPDEVKKFMLGFDDIRDTTSEVKVKKEKKPLTIYYNDKKHVCRLGDDGKCVLPLVF